MGKKKTDNINLVSEAAKVCMTPEDIKKAYSEKHNEDGTIKQVTEDTAEQTEDVPEEAQPPEEKPLDIEQLKKDTAKAIETLTALQTVLNQLVILPDENQSPSE